MGIIDWVILAILLAVAVMGFRRGLIGAVLQIVGTIAVFFLVAHFYPLLRNSLILNFGWSNLLSTILAVVLIAILLLAVLRLLIYLLDRLIKALNLSLFNKLLGLAFGLANGLLAIMVVMLVLDYAPSISTPLKDPEKHRVYVGIDTLKEELVERLNLNEMERYRQLSDRLRKEKEAEETAQ
ncbi:MAG: CvpA family protein [Candidatus Syntrophosphaera sp.]